MDVPGSVPDGAPHDAAGRRRLVLASNNVKKLLELDAVLAPLGLHLVTQGALGVAEAEEPHATFLENALAKARHAARATGGAAIADDSGLCVSALQGAPGVGSAHYATLGSPGAGHEAQKQAGRSVQREVQRQAQDTANNRLLLAQLSGVEDRRARFVSTLVAVKAHDDPEPLVAVGRWHGTVLTEPRGAGGFGYDPLFFIPELGKAVAELDGNEKNRCSHRALAARQMLSLLREAWGLG